MILSTDRELEPGEREAYLQLRADAENVVRAYCGTSESFRALMQKLIAFEGWMAKAHGQKEGEKVSDVFEKHLATTYAPETLYPTIGDLLMGTRARVEELMNQTEGGDELIGSLPMLHVRSSRVLLPPHTDAGPETGSGAGWRPPEFQPRLQLLIQFLLSKGIYVEDVILISGALHGNMMRKKSYSLLEIPRLKKDILVCDQVNESTYVSTIQLGRDTYARLSKEELLQQYASIRFVHFYSQEQWERELGALLFADASAIGPAVDVRDQEEIRQDLLRQGYTPELWVKMGPKERKFVAVRHRKIYAISKVFGVTGSPQNEKESFLEVGAHIFGEGNPTIAKVLETYRANRSKQKELNNDPALWRMEIRKVVPTSAEWLAMVASQRKEFHVHGLGLFALFTIFGNEGNPSNFLDDHIILGACIYGESDPNIAPLLPEARQRRKARHELGKDPKKWKVAFKAVYPDAKSWLALSWEQRKTLEILGFGTRALGTILGLQKGYTETHEMHVQLGALIYGANDPDIAKALKEIQIVSDSEGAKLAATLGKDPEKWKTEFLRRHPDVRAWVRLNMEDRKKIRIGLKGLRWIGSLINIDNDPVDTVEGNIAFTRAMYGDFPQEVWEQGNPKVRKEGRHPSSQSMQTPNTSESNGGPGGS